MKVRAFVIAAALTCFAPACSEDEVPEGAGPAADVAAAWIEADLTVTDFKPANVEIDGECVASHVSEIAVLVCKLPAPKSDKGSPVKIAERAEAQGLELIGSATGASLAHHGRLLVVADRHGIDPTGKVINQITDIFRKVR